MRPIVVCCDSDVSKKILVSPLARRLFGSLDYQVPPTTPQRQYAVGGRQPSGTFTSPRGLLAFTGAVF